MTFVRIHLLAQPPGRRLAIYGGVALSVLALLVASAATVLRMNGSSREPRPSASGIASTLGVEVPPIAAPPHLTATLAPDQNAAIASDITRLQAMPLTAPGTTKRYPPITGEATTQPDLYARAFVSRLLTQDYRRPRSELLAWVQSESAQSSEPMVIGLVPPDLRPRFGLWTLTDSPDGASTPIPTEAQWEQWSQRLAISSVSITNVRIPVKWAAAVAAGELTDPGITARAVDARVTWQWHEGKTIRKSTASVTISLNLEGPPSRPSYGFVNAVTYDVVPEN